MAGCGVGSDCDDVMGSPWGYFLGGVPVSLPAVVLYTLLLVSLLFLGSDKQLDRLLRYLLPLLGGCAVGAALWFFWLQAGVLHQFCPYCTVLHLLGCVLAGMILWRCARDGRCVWAAFFAGVLAAALFAGVQARTLPEVVYDSGSAGEALPVFAEGEAPVLGPADAPEELTLLFDFQCIHCRRLHRLLPAFLDLAGGRYRIRLCPVPLSSSCNPYIPASGTDRFAGSCQLTRLALAVWYQAPEACDAYWDFLSGGGDDRRQVDPADAEALARQLLGEAYEAALADGRIEAYLRRAYELFGRTSNSAKSGVPRLISGRHWIVPEVETADALWTLVQTEFPGSYRNPVVTE